MCWFFASCPVSGSIEGRKNGEHPARPDAPLEMPPGSLRAGAELGGLKVRQFAEYA